MEKYNIIFLDIDGVLNSVNYMKQVYETTGKRWTAEKNMVDPYCLNLLSELVNETDAFIVLSATIRKYEKEKAVFFNLVKDKIPLDRFIGQTISLSGRKRGLEIAQWIEENEHFVGNYVAFDDDHDLANLGKHFINTKNICGLTEEDVLKAKEILKVKTKTR